MLNVLAGIFAITICCAAVVQLVVAVYFHRQFAKKEVQPLPVPHQRQVSVLMCVRGCDPTLRQSLVGLLQQDFEDYHVHLIVDHRSDLAWDVVQKVKREFDHADRLTIHEMCNPLDSCGLKCSALVQGLAEVDKNTNYLVLLDSDVKPHSTWLAELLGPLHADQTIGVVTGNQWFEPPAGSTWGALARSMWNAGALVPTALFQNPWAGTLAMRYADAQAIDISEVWRNSVVDDGPIRDVMNQLGLKIFFAPSLIMINPENCTFSYVNRWVTRMLTWSRLYESTFVLPVAHSIFSNTIMLATFGLLGAAIYSGSLIAVALTTGALLISGLLSVSAYVVVRSAVARSCRLRGEALSPFSLIRAGKLLVSVPVTQLIYGLSCLRALFTQQVQWREITYELRGSSQVRRLNYQPISAPATKEVSKVSI